MKVCGIIAEYNPFHNGHLYHIKEARKISEADYVVVVMSGNFVQRGECAIMDKYSRTQMALSQGADLVLELPTIYATGSAEYFAYGAVSLLEKIGGVTHLCFGSECGDIELLYSIAEKLWEESPLFKEELQKELKKGNSFAKARELAFSKAYPELSANANLLSSPNNILALEYMKALKKFDSKILPLTIRREGAGYNDISLDNTFSSASGIRNRLENGGDVKVLRSTMPKEAFELLEDAYLQNTLHFMDEYSSLLHYKLLAEQNKGYEEYVDVSKDLSDRIAKNVKEYTSFPQFCELLKTKEMAYSRISRSLLHILLDIRKEEVSKYMTNDFSTPYARVLGFRKDSNALLRILDENRTIPMVTKLADASKQLDEAALNLLEKELILSSMYYIPKTNKGGNLVRNEYSTPMIIL